MRLHATCPPARYPVEVSGTSIERLDLEQPLLQRGEVVVGLDEVGRGALAGPMTVGAVVIGTESRPPKGLRDSKQLTPARRRAMVAPLTQWAGDWSLGTVSAEEIDCWGLRLALAVAATRALEGLTILPTFALLDGSFNLLTAPSILNVTGLESPSLRFAQMAHATVVNGDQLCATIAAAAVLAKVYRDEVMVGLHQGFEAYDWAQNKGYGSPKHLEALRQLGPTYQHRQSWNLAGSVGPRQRRTKSEATKELGPKE